MELVFEKVTDPVPPLLEDWWKEEEPAVKVDPRAHKMLLNYEANMIYQAAQK